MVVSAVAIILLLSTGAAGSAIAMTIWDFLYEPGITAVQTSQVHIEELLGRDHQSIEDHITETGSPWLCTVNVHIAKSLLTTLTRVKLLTNGFTLNAGRTIEGGNMVFYSKTINDRCPPPPSGLVIATTIGVYILTQNARNTGLQFAPIPVNVPLMNILLLLLILGLLISANHLLRRPTWS